MKKGEWFAERAHLAVTNFKDGGKAVRQRK